MVVLDTSYSIAKSSAVEGMKEKIVRVKQFDNPAINN